MNSKVDQLPVRRSSITNTNAAVHKLQRRRSFSSDTSWMRLNEGSKNSIDYIPKPTHGQIDAIQKPPTFGSRAPELKLKKKVLYNSQITSVSSAIYDENWASKQADGFKEWANCIFSTSIDIFAPTEIQTESALFLPFQTKVNPENLMSMQSNNGYNEFLQKKSDMINRENAAAIYHDLSTIIGCIEQSVHTRSLSLRDDRDILIDLGLQQELLNIIFNYELPWIRLGLETIFGEIISLPISQKNFNNNYQFPCESGCMKWKNILKVFIQEKFFIHESLLSVSKFQIKSLKEMKGQYLLKKFLFLVLFLDNAKNNNLLNLPILFTRDSSLKSSKDVLLDFSKELMKGGGDFIRHLNSIGYSVSYVQTPLGEFDFIITDVETDFRDGVRLVRLMELVTQNERGRNNRKYKRKESTESGILSASTSSFTSWCPSDNLRVPATSRLQKLHNVSLALKLLYGMSPFPRSSGRSLSSNLACSVDSSAAFTAAHGVGGNEQDRIQEAREIVNGHRDRTLQLLWKIIFVFKLRYLVVPERVIEEYSSISASRNSSSCIEASGISEVHDLAACIKVRGPDASDIGTNNTPSDSKLINSIGIHSDLKIMPSSKNLFDAKQLTDSLLKWCHTITSPYGVHVRNLTTCLADGRALCLVINHYHPLLLPISIICQTTVSLLCPPNIVEIDREGGCRNCNDIDLLHQVSDVSTSHQIRILSKDDIRRGLEGERTNFDVLRSSCISIGGLPMVLPIHDTSDVPEERTMLLFLGYLFGRLIESSNQLKAAVKIQRRVRRKNEIRKREEEAIRISKAAYIIRRRVGTYMQVCAYRSIIAEWRAYKSLSGPLFADGEYSVDEYSYGNLERLEEEQEEYLRLAFEMEELGRRSDEGDEGDNLKEDETPATNQYNYMPNIYSENVNGNKESIEESDGVEGNITVHIGKEFIGGNSRNCAEIVPNLFISGYKKDTRNDGDVTDDNIEVMNEGGEGNKALTVSDRSENIEKKDVFVISTTTGTIHTDQSEEKDLIVRINANKKMLRGFLRLQAVSCGRRERGKSGPNVQSAFVKILKAEKNARSYPNLKLGNQTQLALTVLQTKKAASLLLKAAATIEMTTRYSYQCCQAFITADASRILLALIRSCNRSTAHQELLRCSLSVLLNVSRHQDLVAFVAESTGAADTFVDLMQMFRDKKSIFGMTSELLSRLIAANQITKDLCNKEDFKKRLEGIFHILDRKTRLDEKVKKTDRTGLKSGEFLKLSSGSSYAEKNKNDDDNDKENLSSSTNLYHQNSHRGSEKQKVKKQQGFLEVFEVQDPMHHMRNIMQLLTNQ